MSEELGITVKKSENFSEWFSQVCFKAGLVDLRYGVQGFVVHLPWGMRIIREIYKLFEHELEKRGHEPVLFPVVIPEENLEKEKEHVAGFKPEVFWITHAGDRKLERKLALRPTSETAFYPMYALWIRSYRDLPLKLYQSVAVYRYESHTRPFLRGREFLWIEAHCAFATHDEALEQIKQDMQVCERVIWEELAIPFLFFKRPPWDKFAGARNTYAADTIMPDGKVNQISSTHDLGQNFAKAFDIKFMDENGEKKHVWQTCFGPGIWRIMAALIAIHGDDKGLVLPFKIAPIQVIIVPIYSTKEERAKVEARCEEVKKTLVNAGIRCECDFRDVTPGFKFNDWELKGVPIRIEIGPKEVESKKLTLVRRDTREKIEINESEVVEKVNELASLLLQSLKERARKLFDSKLREAKSREDVKRLINSGFVVKMPFCMREDCAMELKSETNGAKVRGIALNEEQTIAKDTCAWCGREAKAIVYVAKAY